MPREQERWKKRSRRGSREGAPNSRAVSTRVPPWFPPLCASFDFVVALAFPSGPWRPIAQSTVHQRTHVDRAQRADSSLTSFYGSISPMTTIGLIGAGHIGSQVARLAVAHGYSVVISNSRGPRDARGAREGARAPGARGNGRRGREGGRHRRRHDPAQELPERSRSSPWPARSSSTRTTTTRSATGTSPSSTTSRRRRRSSCRRTCRSRRWSRRSTTSTPRSSRRTASRRARRTAAPWSSPATTPSAKATVTELLDAFGFDTVDAGPLKEGWRIQRDTPGYGPRRNAEELQRDLAAAKRYRDR